MKTRRSRVVEVRITLNVHLTLFVVLLGLRWFLR